MTLDTAPNELYIDRRLACVIGLKKALVIATIQHDSDGYDGREISISSSVWLECIPNITWPTLRTWLRDLEAEGLIAICESGSPFRVDRFYRDIKFDFSVNVEAITPYLIEGQERLRKLGDGLVTP